MRLTRTSASLLSGALATVGTVHAQSQFAKALPADTFAFMSMPDIDKSIAEMQNSPLARMWQEQEVQDFLADAMHMLRSQIDEGMAQGKEMHEAGMLPFDPSELTQLRLHSLNIALTSMDLQMMQGDDDPKPKFGMLLHADLGDSAPVWKNAIKTGIGLMMEEAGDELLMTESTTDDGIETMRLQIAQVEGLEMSMNMAFVGNTLVMGTLPSEFSAFLTQLGKTGAADMLATDPDYLRTAQHLQVDGAEIELFVRPQKFIDFGMGALRLAQSEGQVPEDIDVDGIERALVAIGLRSIGSSGTTTAYDGRRCVTDSFTNAPKAERKGFTAMVAEDIDRSLLRWIPKTAASFSIASFELDRIYSTIVDGMRAYDTDVADMMLARLGDMEEQTGISLEKDVFGAFGKRIVSWSMPMVSPMAPPETAVIIEVKNQEGLLKALRTVTSMVPAITLEENKRRNIEVFQLQIEADALPSPEMAAGVSMVSSLMPMFAFKDGNLVAAFNTGDIKRAFKRMDREDDPTKDIRSNAEFAAYEQVIPGSGVVSLSFRDWKSEFEAYYQLATTALAFFPLDSDIPIDLAMLPDPQTLTQHLCGSVTWSLDSESGVIVKSIGPWGPETFALLGLGVGAGAGFVAATRIPRRGW